MFRQRILETMNATMLLALGLVTLLSPHSLDNPALHEFKDHAALWIPLFLIVGATRIIALIINGRWNGGTPTLRFLGALIGAGVFSAIAYGLVENTGFSYLTWGATTSLCIVLGELINSYFTVKDIANNIKYRG